MECNLSMIKHGRLTSISLPFTIVVNDTACKVIKVKCDCGVEKECNYYLFKQGRINSCGCLRNELAAKRLSNKKVHGLSDHPLNAIWRAINSRCYNQKDISYHRYGAKGVTVCEEWRNDFVAFYNWAIENGWQEGLQIDKDIKGNSKLYSPDTCLFVTRQQNCWHRKTSHLIEYNGELKSISEWCSILGLKYDTVRARIYKGQSAIIAFKN